MIQFKVLLPENGLRLFKKFVDSSLTMSDQKRHGEIPLIFILQKGIHSLKTIHRHLIKRGNHVFMSAEIKQFVIKALQDKPNFIFIPMDHPNPAVKNLPQVLGMKGAWTVIPYIETQSTSAALELKKLDTQYFIIPPLSGPKFERMIKKVILDRDREESIESQAPQQQMRNMHKQDSVKITPMSLKIQNSNTTDKNYSIEVSRDSDFSNENWVQIKQPRKSAPAVAPPPEPEDEQKPFWQELEYRASEIKFHREQEANAIASDDNEVDLSPQEGDVKKALRVLHMSGKIPQALLLDPEEPIEDSFNRLYEEYEDQKAQLLVVEKQDIPLENKPSPVAQYESILHAGATHALDMFKQSSSNQTVTDYIQSPTEVICMTLTSKNFYGYMIAVAAKEYLMKHPFEKILKIKLNEYLKENSDDHIDQDAMKLTLKPAPFNEWAKEQALFLTKSVYDGSELAMAFFPHEDVEPNLRQSSREDLVAIDLKELKGDIPVEFDLFLHLPHNKKYIKYTPQGMVFQAKQWERLSRHGIKEMYLSKDNVSNVRRYRAQNFLNDKIEDYMKKFRSKVA